MSTTISDHIKHDLLTRIGSGKGPPTELTIPALSRHYGVSFTPVREALRDLVAGGQLEKGENRRIRVRAKSGPDGTPEVESPSLPPNRASELEEALAEELIARSLRRETDYLREDATGQRFGVSRTVIRQALARLAGRGLVEHVPRCGWRVRAFDEADLDSYLVIREMLELKALELAAPHLVDADLRRMLAGNIAEEKGQAPQLDNDLHRYLIAKANNTYIRDFFDRHGAYYTTVFDFAAPETRIVSKMARQHQEILRALIDRDWTQARESLSRHIREQRKIVGELLRKFDESRTKPR